MLIEIPLRSLVPHYLQGDEVKCRWWDSFGIVQTVNLEQNTITYVESSPIQEVSYRLCKGKLLRERQMTLPMDSVEFHIPPRRRVAPVHAATWVEFYPRSEVYDKKQHGFVRLVEGNRTRNGRVYLVRGMSYFLLFINTLLRKLHSSSSMWTTWRFAAYRADIYQKMILCTHLLVSASRSRVAISRAMTPLSRMLVTIS